MQIATQNYKSVVIVGAGLAGLAAAYKLICEGKIDPNDITILEARDRAGGRVESIDLSNGTRLDLGAQWLHGEKSNPLYAWLLSHDCIDGPEREGSEFQGIFATSFGQRAPDDIVVRIIGLMLETKDFLYKSAINIDKHAKPVDVFRMRIESEVVKCPILKSADKNLIDSLVNWLFLYEMIDNSCDDMSLLSMEAYSGWTDFDEGKMVLLKGGWQNVINKLVHYIGSDKIRLRCKLERIRYNTDGVQLVIADERQSEETLNSEHVILTCSIGVLKQMGPTFIMPFHDERRLSRIANLGFGAINKIFLQFDMPFLQRENGLKLLWVHGSSDERISHLPSWTKFITGFDTISEAPNFLMGWVGGAGAKAIESVSDPEVGQICLRIFKIFLPSVKVPNLLSVTKSAWASDVHIRGAYSYPSIESIDQCPQGLWDPLYSTHVTQDKNGLETENKVPRVLFAGEATADNMYATAHGAVISGWREAERLMAYMKLK